MSTMLSPLYTYPEIRSQHHISINKSILSCL
nr:MAG TPA: hypothetical protein [Bacteriophage sp.]